MYGVFVCMYQLSDSELRRKRDAYSRNGIVNHRINNQVRFARMAKVERALAKDKVRY